MAAWPKISRGGIFEKFSARGGIPKIPPYPPIPVACFQLRRIVCATKISMIIQCSIEYEIH